MQGMVRVLEVVISVLGTSIPAAMDISQMTEEDARGSAWSLRPAIDWINVRDPFYCFGGMGFLIFRKRRSFFLPRRMWAKLRV